MDNITLLDGTVETISGERDFIDLIDRKLGMDAREYLKDILLGYKSQINDVHQDDLK